VCDLSALLGMTVSAVSHQLSILRQARLVRTRRDGKNVYYSLDDAHVRQIIESGYEHINERQ
jgi:ArsR family transcriptional regulator